MKAISTGKNRLVRIALAALSAFCVYTCMYAYRKPFTASEYAGHEYWGIDYKTWLVMAQTLGYTISKFFGIGFIGGMGKTGRGLAIIKLISIAWLSLLMFAICPTPYNIIFLVINGLPLGVIYGLVFSYLEGRRSTELLGAVLATSFIFASGFTQSAGKFVMINLGSSEWWMPWITGLIFLLPLIFFTWLLEQTPPADARDIAARTERLPMSKKERRDFIRTFLPGLFLLILSYVMLTIIRDYRSNFASNMWSEMGYGQDASVFMRSELPASLVVLVLMSLLVLVKNNVRALLINHTLIIAGFLVAIVSTLLYMNLLLSPFWWMTLTGVGLYMGYVPFNCMLFERLIASFKYVGNAGFIIYVADSFGYLGSDMIMLAKNFMPEETSWTSFFVRMVLIMSFSGIVLVIVAAAYFKKKAQQPSSPVVSPKLNYG